MMIEKCQLPFANFFVFRSFSNVSHSHVVVSINLLEYSPLKGEFVCW